MKNTERFLLDITLHDGRKYKRTFKTVDDFEKYKKDRGYFFKHADYSLLDLKVA